MEGNSLLVEKLYEVCISKHNGCNILIIIIRKKIKKIFRFIADAIKKLANYATLTWNS